MEELHDSANNFNGRTGEFKFPETDAHQIEPIICFAFMISESERNRITFRFYLRLQQSYFINHECSMKHSNSELFRHWNHVLYEIHEYGILGMEIFRVLILFLYSTLSSYY